MTASTVTGLSTRRLAVGATTCFGVGAAGELAAVLAGLSRARAFLVTDQGVAASGVVDRIQRDLASAGLEVFVWDDVHPNPDTETLERGGQALRAWGEAAVLAVGGGSVLDAAKGISLAGPNNIAVRELDYRNEPEVPGFPVVAVPTTAGTGSETNSFGVIDDPEAHRKFYVGHPSVLPRAVILDPSLTCGLPAGATAAAGVDALAHALESLSSPGNNPYAEGLNLQVVGMVDRFLPAAVADGQDLEARSQMLLAAHMAGLAFATTGLGLGHAVAHALSARLGAAHGVALGVLLPHVLAFNLPVRAEVYARAAWALGVSDPRKDERWNAAAAVACVRRLVRGVGLPGSLRELGCQASDIPSIARDALDDVVMANTPRRPEAGELEDLLQAAL